MTIDSKHTPVLWRISDGKPGHDSQSKGLVKALNLIKPCSCHDIELTDKKVGVIDLLFGKFPLAKVLPDPDMIIGAGHRTHLPMLCAKRARGGKTVVIMQPSLPGSWFDFCLIPEHDNPKTADNILVTKGAINCIVTSNEQINDHGLILIGGPSKHFSWNSEYLIQQLKEILKTHTDIKWEISGSSRTPKETCKALADMRENNLEYRDSRKTGTAWVSRRLGLASNVWVSADSVSMIYESLTAGAAVGLLDVPTLGTSKLKNNLDDLVENNMLTPYSKWLGERKLEKPQVTLNEANRCAKLLNEAGFLH